MKRQLPQKRATSGRRTVASTSSSDSVALDDRPLAITPTRDGKRLLVALPYEVWVVSSTTLEVERSVEVPASEPSVTEVGKEGALFFGGHHLYQGSVFSTAHTKVGSKLAGVVDRVCSVRPDLLCGVGSQGEILWSISKGAALHRRKASEHDTYALVAANQQPIWADGSSSAWVIDPERPSGYMQLRMRSTSPVEVEGEGVVVLGVTSTGRVVLAARDGGVAWTTSGLRFDAERFPRTMGAGATPLAVAGDERWIYVLRPRGLLQRFLIAQPRPADPDVEEPPLPAAEEHRLRWPASALALVDGHLTLGGPQAEGLLGRLWRCDPEALEWRALGLTTRTLHAPATSESPSEANKAPNFTPTRSKISGPPLAQLKVDEVLAARSTVLITSAQGTITERLFGERPAAEVMPADVAILPAMVRFREGGARPALLLWPGTKDPEREPPEPTWLVWGDAPREWIPLTTPRIREQGWSRPALFPMQVALASAPTLAGHRQPLPERWVDPEQFTALARECKRLLKVLW
jgi:hypothetical protein